MLNTNQISMAVTLPSVIYIFFKTNQTFFIKDDTNSKGLESTFFNSSAQLFVSLFVITIFDQYLIDLFALKEK